MTEQEAMDFGASVAARLATNEAIDTILPDVLAKMPALDATHFLPWARWLVDGANKTSNMRAYRERLHQLNVLLVKEPAFADAIRRFHAAKNKPASVP